jgi:hypothetical protein
MSPPKVGERRKDWGSPAIRALAGFLFEAETGLANVPEPAS